MSNRFEHLKEKGESPKTLDEFIEGANLPREAKIAKERRNTEEVLLIAQSRMTYDSGKASPFLLRLGKDLADDIDKYCHGSKQAILNHLIERGLEDILKKEKLILL